jgi:hypothetical protein
MDSDKVSKKSTLKSTFKSLKNKLTPRRSSSRSNDFNRKEQTDPYLYITNLEQATDDECLSADKQNESIYSNELQTFNDVTSLMDRRNASFQKPIAPKHPPKPSNIENLYEYRRKHVKTQALEQTEAVIYLYSIGKKYVREKTGDPNEFEAYEAIKLAIKIKEHCPGDKMFQDRRDENIWDEKSEIMTRELKNQSKSRSRLQSVYDLDSSSTYQDRIRSASYSSGDTNHSKGVYPVLPSAPMPCNLTIT